MSSLITFDPPSPSSVQSLSPLPFHGQAHAFAQGLPQQPLPYMFLPPGLPNHFEQAYEQENGTIVFADNYAPINPFSPPPGYYTGMAPVVNTSGMIAGNAPSTTAAMLGLYELNPPYAHFNPNLGIDGNGFPLHQPPARTSPVPPMASVSLNPLSTASLTPHEQEVFSAILGNSQMPLTLEDLIPLSLSLSDDPFVAAANSVAGFPTPATPPSLSSLYASISPKELSFAGTQTGRTENPASTMPQSPARNQCA
ncbi:hypothetical protein BDM02DRAFT_3110941 [Thelephora ganbajun]|uniref:Uncharacterized protein n=1 Tax=Thelephora ganbajun TaxID=370292 RepID=A0ACB6ZNL2_THEGA|nr:hypothetical protein BDM02DRAFT_3110941 [Thelephora ganbajun]